jgi:hypothetical protein
MRVFTDTRLHRRGADAKYIFLNSLNALLHPREFLRDLHTIRKIKSSLESLARDNASADSKAPNIFHFVWGLSGKSEAFPYYAYMAVASALFYNPGAKAIFHYGNEPSGEFWDRTKSKVILNKVENFERFGIARLHHFAHKADVVRLFENIEVFIRAVGTPAGTITQSRLLACYRFIIQEKLRSCPSITFSIRCGLTFPAF